VTGYIQKRGNSYRLLISTETNEDGKKKQKWAALKGNYKVRNDQATRILYEVQQGTWVEPGKVTAAEFLDRWLRDYSKPNLAPAVHANYELIVNKHLKPALGKIRLTNLQTPRISKYQSDKLASGLAAQTVRNHHAVLHKAFETAIEWGLIQRNPAEGAKSPRVNKPEMSTYEPDQVVKFLEEAKKTEYYPIFQLSLFEGMRRSEVLALRWKDIDLVYGQISVNRSMQIIKGREIVYRSPKTAKSKRNIPLTPTSYLILKEHYEKSKAVYKKLETKINDGDLVFCHLDTGEPYRPDTISKAWSRITIHGNLPHIRLHDARHTMATIMLKKGIHPKIVQERLGHSSIQITLDTYSHVTPSMQQAAAKSFDEVFKPEYNNVDDKNNVQS